LSFIDPEGLGPAILAHYFTGKTTARMSRRRIPAWLRPSGWLIDFYEIRAFFFPKGVRVIGIVPLGTWETITFVAALRHNKMTAPMVIEGAMTGEMFLAYVEQCLVPTLRRIDIVVMDRAVLQRAGACRSASRVHLRFGDPKSLRSKRPSTKPSASAFGHGTSTYMRYNRAATHDHG
jgi:hypothetical protein